MCGIIGYGGVPCTIGFQKDFLFARDILHHRGPDGADVWWSTDRKVGLGHRRLSILDLSSTGDQPMRAPELGLTIVFNGEIYNYQELKDELANLGPIFRNKDFGDSRDQRKEINQRNQWNGSSDTEVLLAMYAKYGTNCLRRLNGMFSFAIYDERKGYLFMARDRAGEKPFFYRIQNNSLWFASELKALMAIPGAPRKMDSEALDYYLGIGYVPGEKCILQGYQKLKPGHAMTFNIQEATTRIWKWWEPEFYKPELENQEVIETKLIKELKFLLQDSVKKQLNADVPIGVLLSGGVDSSLITAMAAQNGRKIKTFTVGFPGHKKFNESHHARLIADNFNTEHTELTASLATAEILEKIAKQFDEPIADSSIIPTFLLAQKVSENCKVVLGGDGADELFAGYPIYNRLKKMGALANLLPRSTRHSLGKLAELRLPIGFKGRGFLKTLDFDPQKNLPDPTCFFDATNREKLLPRSFKCGKPFEDKWRSSLSTELNLLSRAIYQDFTNYLPEDILVKTDRASMLNSLEIRAPFLDYRVIEFAFAKCPEALKADGKNKKIILKKIAKELLPSEFDIKRKHGFSVPLASWLKAGPFHDLFASTLNSQDCFFDKKFLKKLQRLQKVGCSNSERLFQIVFFELWRKSAGVTI